MTSDLNRSVFVLDSGVGGMTIVSAIKQLKLDVSITYLADNAFFPYGELAEEALINRCRILVGQALYFCDFDAIIIACNTASTIVLDALRAEFSVPIIGVVPPIKTAGEKSRSRVIGLLATEGTVKRSYIDELVENFAADCHIIKVGCPELAVLAEEKIFGKQIDAERLHAALAPMRAEDPFAMDVLILGCTHFPILLEELQKEITGDILWLDPAVPVAQHLERILKTVSDRDIQKAATLSENHLYFSAGVLVDLQGNEFFKQLGFLKASNWSEIIGLT